MHRLLTPLLAESFASVTLRNVLREYPNKLDHVMAGPADVLSPRALHPAFYGCFDWHSCVHGVWQLARLRRLFPATPAAAAVEARLDELLTPENLQVELRYFQRPESRGFERPYGWAWLLKLSTELRLAPDAPAQRWAAAVEPLARLIAERLAAFLARATYPVRAGTHGNTAFALRLALDYATTVDGNDGLRNAIVDAAGRWYARDAGCQAWEPSQDDFLSPALVEAELMRRALPHDTFAGWLALFLPNLGLGEPATLFTPATVADRTDGKIAHLDGLNFSRAWCWRGIASSLGRADPLRPRVLAAADVHLEASLPHIGDDYAGEHWLATFALLAMSEEGG